jgi:hypothetical protein
MSEENGGNANQTTGETIPPARGEITLDTPRQVPLKVPWTWREYYAVRYLEGCRKEKLSAVAIAALWRGLHELARETVADRVRRGKIVPQRLALLARGDFATVPSGQSEEKPN